MDQLTPEQKQKYLNEIKSTGQTTLVNEMVSTMTEMCFKKCTGKSGNHLDSREESCLNQCVGRYMDTMGVVNQALAAKQSH